MWWGGEGGGVLPGCGGGGGFLLIKDNILSEGQHSQVGSIDNHGCTASIWIHPHNWSVIVVDQPSLGERRR